MDALVSKKFFVTVFSLVLIAILAFFVKTNIGAILDSVTFISIAFIGGQTAVDAMAKYKNGSTSYTNKPQVSVTLNPKVHVETMPADPPDAPQASQTSKQTTMQPTNGAT